MLKTMSILLFAISSLSLVATIVGIRILLVAKRTQGFAELSLGVMLLSLGAFSIPLNSAGQAFASVETSALLSAVSSVFSAIGIIALYLFTAHVFHRSERWALMIVGFVAATLAYYVVGYSSEILAAQNPAQAKATQVAWAAFTVVPSILGYSWSGWSAFAYYRTLRKRLRLGLADPVVVNRMLLWSLIGIVSVATALSAGVLLSTENAFLRDTVQPVTTAIGGLLDSILLLLAFAPPSSYLGAVKRSAEATA